ncbi:MAG: NYN domain-containing protein [Afipia sp.]
MIRVLCYIDGFNLYHAIDDMSRASRGELNHLKWLDLNKLMTFFIDPKVHKIEYIKYFSAYATWKPKQHERHQIYTKALASTGVQMIMGQFKEKEIYCPLCKLTHIGHEEKESDVNIAVHLVADAHTNAFDQAFIVTRDSDLSGPIRYIRSSFPEKKIKVVAPPQRGHSKELWALANARAAIKKFHLENSLFAETVTDSKGAKVCTRPVPYAPKA